ncbi:MAG: methyltransferase domain-containing protein [Proteobacteria bacterium]|nr:methyltransferase domain-containing protein [Pseudomonadota bacterium]
MYSEADQRNFWNKWNVSREETQGRVSSDQQRVVLRWLDRMGRRDLRIIEVGCGAGWLCSDLTRYGRVVGTDLSDEVLARAAERLPEAEFIAGDFLTLDLGEEQFDVVVTLETLTHVPDQAGFVRRCSRLLKPGGLLMMATQNKTALQRNRLAPPERGQYRRWVDRDELVELMREDFEIEELFSITPKFNRGPLKILNSERLHRPIRAIGLGGLVDSITRMQERAWLGWTLMALARKSERRAP